MDSISSHVEISAEAKTFNWLLGSFATRTAGVQEAIVVSSDGLLMAKSSKRERADSDRRRHGRRLPGRHLDQPGLGAGRHRE